VSISPPIFWRQQIGWSYCAASRTFGLVAWPNSNKKVSLSEDTSITDGICEAPDYVGAHW